MGLAVPAWASSPGSCACGEACIQSRSRQRKNAVPCTCKRSVSVTRTLTPGQLQHRHDTIFVLLASAVSERVVVLCPNCRQPPQATQSTTRPGVALVMRCLILGPWAVAVAIVRPLTRFPCGSQEEPCLAVLSAQDAAQRPQGGITADQVCSPLCCSQCRCPRQAGRSPRPCSLQGRDQRCSGFSCRR